MTDKIIPFSIKDEPALIERLFPVQKLSAETYKERTAGAAQALTALGNFWRGRKPLILAKACVLGCLLPATDDQVRDLEVFEKLMAMDDESFVARWRDSVTPRDVLEKVSIARISDYFTLDPPGVLPASAPVDWSNPEFSTVRVTWREDVSQAERRHLEAESLPKHPYRERVGKARRPEEVSDIVHNHIWDAVNSHLRTNARTFPELVEQLGIMRFGHRPRVADTFCGSGQIPFEAARVGCDVYASDLNPVASLLTWSAFNVVGASKESRVKLVADHDDLTGRWQQGIDELGVEDDGKGWRIRGLLYCVEVRCPQSGWMVPLLPSLVLSEDHSVIAELVPNPEHQYYDIRIRSGVSESDLVAAKHGTITREGRFGEAYLEHLVEGVSYKTRISTLRGDYKSSSGSTDNRVRHWEKHDFKPRQEDIFQERLYAILWSDGTTSGRKERLEFREVTPEDLKRENAIEEIVAANLPYWQEQGWVPDMRIEVGGPPRYQGLDLIKARGWTHWHHLFNPRQLLLAGLLRENLGNVTASAFFQVINHNSRLSRWNGAKTRGYGNTTPTFDNQALNTLYSYGCRGTDGLINFLNGEYKELPISKDIRAEVRSEPARDLEQENDIYITDPPYGDAVKYEEILDFFVGWLRKDTPPEFEEWVWDSRRVLAIAGDGENFRRGMVDSYRRMVECMPNNGIQVIMFTHQSASLWADMANIIWASGLQVTAAWYVATETDNSLREGAYVKGTVLLVCRKRQGSYRITRDDLAWEIQEEVEAQVESLTGLNQQAKGLYRDANVFEDADLQMAGYAAALRSLTHYGYIDGRDMPVEAMKPKARGETSFVDDLITFAVDTANQSLVPQGIDQAHWDRLGGAERFYLKMLDLEARGGKSLDNYQNFAKAFKVSDFRPYLASQKANDARLKSAAELGADEMSEGSELHQSTLRAILYAMMELEDEVDGADVLAHLTLNIPDYYGDSLKRALVISVTDYVEGKLNQLRPNEAGSARVLSELVKNQRLG